MNWVYGDGGRKAAGFRGDAGDGVARSQKGKSLLILDRQAKLGRRCALRSRARIAEIFCIIRGLGESLQRPL
jgi:hypothetical protein